MPLSIEFVPDARPATAMLHLVGEADYREAPALRGAVFDAIGAAEGRNLVVELDRVARIDTAALAVLVEGLIAARDTGTDVFLMHPSESVRRVFQLAGLEEALTQCFDCWEDLATAIAS